MMIGGDKAVVDRLDPIFAALGAGRRHNRQNTRTAKNAIPVSPKAIMHAGPAGAGPFRQDGP